MGAGAVGCGSVIGGGVGILFVAILLIGVTVLLKKKSTNK